VPWRFLPDGHQYTVHRDPYPGLDDERWTGGQWLADQGFERHALQLGYVDRLLGRLLDRLRETGLYDKSLIVLTADHGVSFRAGQGRRAAGTANLADIAFVPLFIKAPGQRSGRVDDRIVRSVDILPTVAERLRTRLPWRVDGKPAGARGDARDARIAVSRVHSEPASLPFGQLLAQREERDAYEARMSGTSLYAIGPRPELVGRQLGELDPMPASGQSVELDGSAELTAVAPGTGFVPAFVSGALTGVAEGEELAIAVNRRIEATTRVRREGDTLVFSALVPPSSLRRGANDVAVLQILGGDRLRDLGGVGGDASYRLVGAGDRQSLVNGRERIPVEPKAVAGFVDGAELRDGQVALTGWAAPTDLSRPADRIVVVAGGRQLESQRPSVVREDIGEWKGPLRRAGYAISIPARLIESARGPLQVYGLAGGRATLLEQIGNVPETLASLP
jgi:hypothetical protein